MRLLYALVVGFFVTVGLLASILVLVASDGVVLPLVLVWGVVSWILYRWVLKDMKGVEL